MYIYIYPCNTFPLGKNSNKYKGFVKCAFLKVKHNSFTGLNAHPEPLVLHGVVVHMTERGCKWVTHSALYEKEMCPLGKFWIKGLNVLSFLRPLPRRTMKPGIHSKTTC